jgi:hypothetical protein
LEKAMSLKSMLLFEQTAKVRKRRVATKEKALNEEKVTIIWIKLLID